MAYPLNKPTDRGLNVIHPARHSTQRHIPNPSSLRRTLVHQCPTVYNAGCWGVGSIDISSPEELKNQEHLLQCQKNYSKPLNGESSG